jgi:hypothetical protein
MDKFQSVPTDGQTDIYSNGTAPGLGDWWYASPNIIHMLKSRIMKWVGHVACIGMNIN